MSSQQDGVPDVASALGVTPRDGAVWGRVPPGYDVFGVPHGGFLAGLAGAAVLEASGAPDIFSITLHYLRKAEVAPIRFALEEAGASRRFRSVRLTATQGEHTTLAVSALVGDRSGIDGPGWRSKEPWAPTDGQLLPAEGIPMPEVAQRMGLRLAKDSVGFATGALGDTARIHAVVEGAEASVLTALIACDLTPPAVWNALGLTGWVPTVELTAHVRARPAPGIMSVEVETHHVAAGFLEEDARVYDSAGTLIVQSRQLARYSEGKTKRPV